MPYPQKLIEGGLVGVHPRGARVFPHGRALKEPGMDIIGVRQVGHHGEAGAAE